MILPAACSTPRPVPASRAVLGSRFLLSRLISPISADIEVRRHVLCSRDECAALRMDVLRLPSRKVILHGGDDGALPACASARLPQGAIRAGGNVWRNSASRSSIFGAVTAPGFGHPGREHSMRRTPGSRTDLSIPGTARRVIGNSIKHDCSHVCSRDTISRQLRTFAARSHCCELDSGEQPQSASGQEGLVMHRGPTKRTFDAAIGSQSEPRES